MTFEKRITIETQNSKGIFLYNLDAQVDSSHLTKTAAEYHPDIAQYIRTAQVIPGKLQVLVTALGALEFYGPNVNGDSFPEEALKHEGTDYGYKTFEHLAKVFKHHVNKPDSPSYGTVRMAVWNDKMKRVELILIVDRALAPDICERIDNGEFPALSMGCRVPYDVCSCCGNKAKTRKDYCEHLKFYMNKIPPGYTKTAHAINTLPKFFDISFVIIGADSIAKVMKKVASAVLTEVAQPDLSYEHADSHNDPRFGRRFANKAAVITKVAGPSRLTGSAKTAASMKISALAKAALIGKRADMDKEVPSNLQGNVAETIAPAAAAAAPISIPADIAENAAKLRAVERPIPRTIIVMISRPPEGHRPDMSNLSRVLSTLMGLGILPSHREFQDIALHSLGHSDLAHHLAARNQVFHPSADMQLDNVKRLALMRYIQDGLHVSPDHFDEGLVPSIRPMLAERSYMNPYLESRLADLAAMPRGYFKVASAEQEKVSFVVGPVGMMAFLAGVYASFNKINPNMSASAFEKFVSSRPALAAAIGVGAIVAGKQLMQTRVVGKYDADPRTGQFARPLSLDQYVASRNDVPYAGNMGNMKTASLAKKVFLGVPAIYLASGLQESKRARTPDSQEGIIGGIVRENPDVLSGALVGEHLLGRPISSKLEDVASKGLSALKNVK
jgi:hypothetical protein